MQEKLQQVFFRGVFLSLYQDIAHNLDVLVTIITAVPSFVSTCVAVIMVSSSTKPNSGVTIKAVVFIVTKYTDSCFRMVTMNTSSIEPFLVTVVLQGGLRTNQWLPLVTTQWGVAVLPISHQSIQGTGALRDFDKIDLVVDLHSEADLGEGCVPVGGKFCLLWVKSSLASINIKAVFIFPVCRGVVERLLCEKQLKIKAR